MCAQNIPTLQANINAGQLASASESSPGRQGSDDGVFLISNGVYRDLVYDAACNRSTQLRNPLTLALTDPSGRVFNRVYSLFNNTAPKRYDHALPRCGGTAAAGATVEQNSFRYMLVCARRQVHVRTDRKLIYQYAL